MKILITNHHLDQFAGSETYTYALVSELLRRDHQVSALTAVKGQVSARMEESGCRVYLDPREAGEDFDVIHAHHNSMAIVARHYFSQTPMVFVSHGIAPGLEEPPSAHLGLSATVGVSEEVVENLRKNHAVEQPVLIRNGVDTGRFSPQSQINQSLKSILVISNRIEQHVLDPLLHAAQRLGAAVNYIGLKGSSVWETEAAINQADLVVSLGRGALEAMSCGRAVLIYDIHGSDGLITEESYPEIRRHNFSGRRYARRLDAEALLAELEQYTPEMGEVNRKLVVENHSIESMADSFEQVYRQACEAETPTLPHGVGGREILFYQEYWRNFTDLQKSHAQLYSENQALREQLNVLKQKVQAAMQRRPNGSDS